MGIVLFIVLVFKEQQVKAAEAKLVPPLGDPAVLTHNPQ